MSPTRRFQDDHFLSFLEVEDEEEVCGGEEGGEEEGVQLLPSMVRPLLSPPAHGYPDEEGVPRPDFVLIEQDAYFIDRDNATTASCPTGPDLKGEIKVTFCTAPPPLVSYFCVHATEYTHADLVIDPLILATETDGGLVLFCLVIGESKTDLNRPSCQHFFVYDSGTRGNRPLLKHIPHPKGTFGGNYEFNGASLAIVRDCNRKREGEEHGNPARGQGDNSESDNYRGPTLRPRHTLRPPRRSSSVDQRPHSGFGLRPHSGFTLQPHSGFTLQPHSGSGAFALHPHAASNQEEHDCSKCDYMIVARDCDFGYKSPSYLIFYHSRTESWGFKTVQVPAAYEGHFTTKTLTIGEEVAWFDLSRNAIFCDVLAETPKIRVVGLPPPSYEVNDPRSVRDIAIVDGYINYVEVDHQINNGIIDSWMAVKWSMKITGHSEDWHMDHKVCSSNISAGSSKLEASTAQPNFRRLHLGLPNLSLEDKNLVYFLGKINFWDSEQPAWVLAIDLKNNSIHEVMEYNAIKTVGLFIGYGASRISKYLRAAPGTKRKQKRGGLPLLRRRSKK